MALRSRNHVSPLAAIFILTGVLNGCTEGAEVDTTANADVYGSVILDVAARSGVELDDSDDLPTVFIEAFDADGIALEVQVEVVNDLIEQYDVRFIDDREEAIDVDLPDLPVRANSLLVGLGPLVRDGTIDVRTELYLSSDAISAYRYTLVRSNDGWAVVEAPEEIEPEGFVSVE